MPSTLIKLRGHIPFNLYTYVHPSCHLSHTPCKQVISNYIYIYIYFFFFYFFFWGGGVLCFANTISVLI